MSKSLPELYFQKLSEKLGDEWDKRYLMSDKPWKKFERDFAKILGEDGARFWANSGESVDCENKRFVAQCKHVKNMSLNKIAELCEDIEFHSEKKDKRGVVGLKTRPGKGRKATTIVAMTAETFIKLRGE